MRVPHWWSRDRSSCRHLWYPITGLRRNTPRIVHLPASVLENGASRPWDALAYARVSARTLDFRRAPKVAVNTGFDDLRRRSVSVRGGNERSIANRRPVAGDLSPLRTEECGVAEKPLSRVLSASPLNEPSTASPRTDVYRSAGTTRQKVQPNALGVWYPVSLALSDHH